MPLRYTPTGAALHRFPATLGGGQRFFHVSRRLEGNSSPDNNHYDTLNVHPDASPAEIKKSFYHLSKRHHPDHNPADPSAPHKFMRISEAYAILSHTDKRARYDHDVLRRSPYHPAHSRNHPHDRNKTSGSYHSSTGPAGGRPASGLSRRRSAFQGPPPSFFRSGGWGAHGAKRRAAHDESTGYAAAGAGAGYGTNSNPGPGANSPGGDSSHRPPPPGAGGMGPGQDPFGHHNDVPHFDRAAHERAQRRGDERRAQKIAKERGVNLDPESGSTMSFMGVAMILAAVVSGPFVISWLGRNGGPPTEKEREMERERKARVR